MFIHLVNDALALIALVAGIVSAAYEAFRPDGSYPEFEDA